MKDISTKRPEERKSLHGRLAEFRQALEEEIQKIEKNGQSSTTLTGGKRITSQNGEYWYRFYVEYAPVIPADTPCKLIILKEEYNVNEEWEYLRKFMVLLVAYGGHTEYCSPRIIRPFDLDHLSKYRFDIFLEADGYHRSAQIRDEHNNVIAKV